MSSERANLITSRPPGLVDVLDRILDKGLVVAGDIKVSLANVELLTIQIRLLVCSIDKAEQIGLDWWRYDSNLTARTGREDQRLGRRVAELELEVERLSGKSESGKAAPAPARRRAPAASGRRRKERER